MTHPGKKIKKIVNKMKKETEEWVKYPFNKKITLQSPYTKYLDPFIKSNGAENSRSVPHALSTVSTWYVQNFENEALVKSTFCSEALANFASYKFWCAEAKHGAMGSSIGGAYNILSSDLLDFLLFCAAGWKEHALRFVDTVSAMDELDRVSTPLPYGTLPKPLEGMALLLMRDWAGLDIPAHAKTSEMGPYGELLDLWRSPDHEAFDRAMYAAADQHVLDCGEDDVTYPITQEDYWLFPIELLAVYRLRQWEGLHFSPPDHPLFNATVMGQLHPPIPVPCDEKLQQVLDLYAQLSDGVLNPKV